MEEGLQATDAGGDGEGQEQEEERPHTHPRLPGQGDGPEQRLHPYPAHLPDSWVKMPSLRLAPKKAHETKIHCRFCGPESTAINRQSYPDHLATVHNDTSGNLREYGQASLFQMIAGPSIRQDGEEL